MAMIGDRGFRPAPHAVFVTATVLFVFALLAAALCASRLPWTGLILDLAESEGAPRLLEPPAGSPAEGRVEADDDCSACVMPMASRWTASHSSPH